MDVLRDQTHIGMFEPQDVALLQSVFARLNAADLAVRDEAKARSLARSIIKLYRHGVRDPQQLFETLRPDR
ncbi:hypothetical protein [Shinella pollutisoli]|uniref:Uncharacterized protein n=1 Tax=Shinella pollutisoli TaxID=2250594 RepID=A0ABV7DI99_9HYPH|nr:hypothetical protein [Shinella pollutisoli]